MLYRRFRGQARPPTPILLKEAPRLTVPISSSGGGNSRRRPRGWVGGPANKNSGDADLLGSGFRVWGSSFEVPSLLGFRGTGFVAS